MVEYCSPLGELHLELVGPHELPAGAGVRCAYHVTCHDRRFDDLAERAAGFEDGVMSRCAVCLDELREDEPIMISYRVPEQDDARTSEVVGPFDQPRDPDHLEAAFHMACWGTRMRGGL